MLSLPALRRSLPLLLLLALLAVATAATGAGAAAPAPTHEPGTILVKFVDEASARAVVAAHGDRDVSTTANGVHVVHVAGGSVDESVAAYSRAPGVVYAEPNYIAHATLAVPNDPSFGSQWALSKIGATGAWSAYPGSYVSSGGAKLAIVDTGVQSNHPDLTGRVVLGINCVNAFSSCASGAAEDDNGHGTHVAGIAAATTNNALGVAGVAFSSPIVAVKVLDAQGSGTYAAITNGIIWAAGHGVRVMNLSLSGSAFSQTLCDAVAQVTANGALVVAAAGNGNTSAAAYPAACPGAVGVAATDPNDARASFSNFGAPDVFIAAPGVSIFSTYFGSSYATLSGTSMASPMVTGLAALLFGQLPSRTPATIKSILASTAQKVGGISYGADPYGTCGGCTWSSSFGYGRIDAAAALGAAPAPPPPSPDFSLAASPTTQSVTAGNSTTYSVSVAPTNGFNSALSFSASGLPPGATASFNPQASATSSTMTVQTSASTPAGNYTVTVTGTDGNLSRSTQVALGVNASPTPDFSLSINPGIVGVIRGQSVSYAVTVNPSGGFTGPVALSVSGLPVGATGTFSPTSTTSTSTLTVSTVVSIVGAMQYPFTVTGTGGGLTRTVGATLVVHCCIP